MGSLLYGVSLPAMAAALERGPPVSDRFGVLSAARSPIAFTEQAREWVADHARKQGAVVARPLWLELLRRSTRELLPVCAERREALVALDATLMTFAAEGLTAVDIRRLGERAGVLDNGALLPRVADIMERVEEACRQAGLVARSAAVRAPSELSAAPVGVVLGDPGRSVSRALARALRQFPAARIALLYQPGEYLKYATEKRFLYNAEREMYGVSEREVSAEALPVPEFSGSELERALHALAAGCDVYSPRWFAPLQAAAGAAFGTSAAFDHALLGWAEEPLSRAAAITWLRGRRELDQTLERRLLMSPAELTLEGLPPALARRHRERPRAPHVLSAFLGWLGLDKPSWADQAEALGILLDAGAWARALSDSRAPSASGNGPAALTAPWVPSGVRPVLYLESPLQAPPRALLTPRLQRFIVKSGLGAFASHRDTNTVLVERFIASTVQGPLPVPPLLPLPPVQQVSVSALVDYAHCPQRFALRHVLRSRPPPSQSLSQMEMGAALHRVLERVLRPLLGEELTAERIDIALSAIAPAVHEDVRAGRHAVPLSAKDEWRAEQWSERLRAHLERDLRGLAERGGTVAGVEWPVQIEAAGLQIRGRIDRLDRVGADLWLRDYKMSRSPPALSAPEALQLFVYGEALNWQVSLAAFDSLATGEWSGASSDPRLAGKGMKAQAPKEALAPLRELFASVVAGISAGDFSPRPATPEECANCGVRALCRFVPEPEEASVDA